MRNESAGPGVVRRARMIDLGRDEALALLATAPIGRVVFSQRALPAVRPVNFAVHGPDVVFRVRGDSRFAGALDGNVVAFEADQIDPARRAGWSVVVTGLAELLTGGADYERLLAVAPVPWAPGDHNRVVRVRVELVTGRRISRRT
ncbi:pyridoxamine 5'-phosphate oxidase family protein [Yinghuangia sp. ASG 101]|uniref:pyridoxamine 5'-phosphate oxidase family protein n=1 Tax=Yinghuangia sp. ASG 101 TaxID=2896848 RepID=UPI001E28A272|nr:pyridoxamine 5'-phosphate oxidase family protein [Yinghuangia sp. ASG 101]UGQ12693.1 pyridoxamine 5'-phosphate oxidase family protein [Yinghuangia sp. ASG 101]